MKYIHPMEIASKIMTLIDLSNEHLVIVSPYVNFKRWDKMKACLKRAIDRGVKIEFYIRDNVDTDLEPFLELNIRPVRKENLHAKLYYNEQYGIVTSQNMIRYSDDYSIDIGYETESKDELSQLQDFKKRYLHNGADTNTVELTQTTDAQQQQEETFPIVEDLDKDAVDKVYRSLKRTYPDASFNPTTSYVYSSSLLGWPDAMIGSTFTVKFGHNNNLCNKLESLDLTRYNILFRRNISSTHKRYTYVDFIPVTSMSTEELIQSYHFLIKDIKAAAAQATTEARAQAKAEGKFVL